MGGLDPAKIFLILVITLIVVGPERLPVWRVSSAGCGAS